MREDSDKTTTNSGQDVPAMGSDANNIEYVDKRFEITDHVYAARTSDGFRAIDLSNGRSVLLWLLRYSLPSNSDASLRFVKRLEKIKSLNISVPNFITFGVDSSNKAYLVTDFISKKSVLNSQAPVTELQRIFLEIITIVAELHRAGVVISDICEDSFVLPDDGHVLICGLLGGFDVEAVGTTMLPPAQTLHYLSPEQRSGAGLVPASDVFALGVLGYRLFTGRYAVSDGRELVSAVDVWQNAPAPTSLRTGLPSWVDRILKKCLVPQSSERFGDAAQLYEAVSQALRGGPDSMSTEQAAFSSSPNTHKTMIIRPSRSSADSLTSSQAMSQAMNATTPELHNVKGAKASPYVLSAAKKFLMVVSVALVLGVIVAGVVFLLIGDTGSIPEEQVKHVKSGIDDPEPVGVNDPLYNVLAPGLSIEQRKESLKRIAQSKDAMSYAVLLRAMKRTKVGELRNATQVLVVTRIEQSKLKLSASVIEKWFKSKEKQGADVTQSPGYNSLLKACDTSVSLEQRRFALNKAFVVEREVAFLLAAALALDEDESHFSPVLRQFMSDDVDEEILLSLSVSALVLGNELLSSLFEAQVATRLGDFSSRDLAWVLVRLGNTESPLFFDVVDETLRRKIVPPFQAVFLKTLSKTNRVSLPANVRRTLVRGARGELREDDVIALGRWISLEAESVLLVICAISEKKELALSAFDTLAARSLMTEPARSLVSWIKSRFWDYRMRIVKAVGIMGHSDIAQDEQIDYAFDMLMPFTKDGSLFALLVKADIDFLLTRAVERLGEISSNEELLPLLTHRSKDVRLATIYALNGRNDLMVLRAITRAYNKEQEEEIRAVYEELHWVTRKEQEPR